MNNLLALGFVLLVLSACGAHVYTNTRLPTQMRADDPRPYWHPDGRSIRGLE